MVNPTEARAAALRVTQSAREKLGITVYFVDDFDEVETIAPASAITDLPADVGTDAFGVPMRFFGAHPETVRGAIGCTVALSAHRYDRLVLLQALNAKPQTK